MKQGIAVLDDAVEPAGGPGRRPQAGGTAQDTRDAESFAVAG